KPDISAPAGSGSGIRCCETGRQCRVAAVETLQAQPANSHATRLSIWRPDYPFLAPIRLRCPIRSRTMVREPLRRDLKKAIERLEAEPARSERVGDRAELSVVPPRTLPTPFHLLLASTPRTLLRELR